MRPVERLPPQVVDLRAKMRIHSRAEDQFAGNQDAEIGLLRSVQSGLLRQRMCGWKRLLCC
jgi:hypothetical protein